MRTTSGRFLLAVVFCASCTLLPKCLALKCLACTNIENPTDCETIKLCDSREVCSTEKFVDTHGFIRYNLDCKAQSRCSESTAPVGSTTICTECCSTELCAINLCGLTGYPQEYGPVCYNCDYPEAQPDACDTIRQCDSNQVCGVNQLPTGQYEIKCRHQRLCEVVMHQGVCAKCCTDQLCNNDCAHGSLTTTTTTTTTTPAPTTAAPVSNGGCGDEDSCQKLIDAVGHDGVCLTDLKVFCNQTCALCPACTDEQNCEVLKSAFGALGKNVCLDASLNTFCKASCGLCSAATTTAATTPTTQMDMCRSNPCIHGSCVSQVGTYTCRCFDGYNGDRCEQMIDHCVNHHCVHGKCTNKVTGYDCVCETGYTGTTCKDIIDHCVPMPCLNHGTCINNLVGYTCQCPSSFTGSRCETVRDYCDPQPCNNGAGCISYAAASTFICSCPTGYIGRLCEYPDLCAVGPCVHGRCSNDLPDHTYNCRCDNGFEGHNCDQVINYCATQSCGHGRCFNHVGGFSCLCEEGFDGTTCTHEIDHCASSPCLHGSCVNNHHNYSCHCSVGYEGTLCDKRIDYCASHPCQHGGQCSNLLQGYACSCLEGFTGKMCETEIDHCQSNQCGNGRCINNHHNYTCQCSTGYEGTLCDTVINHCSPSPCVHGRCNNLLTGFVCLCDYGYEGTTCNVAHNYCQPNPCVHGSCLQQLGGFRCACVSGYTGHRCSYKVLEPCGDEPGCVSLKDVLQLQNQDVCQNPTLKYFCNDTCGHCPVPQDCQDLQAVQLSSGSVATVYNLTVSGSIIRVNCDMNTDGGGWLVVMNRRHGSTSFDQTTTAYDTGFGDALGELWIGLVEIARLTASRHYQLRVDITLVNGSSYHANYDDFAVGSAPTYNLTVGKYYGDAGDALTRHSGRPFVSPDHAGSEASTMCAKVVHAGWWFDPSDCLASCLTCSYTTYNNCPAVTWLTLGHCQELESIRMMIRPV